jgi:uncharacterized protein YjiS (DUF1127 family)
MMATTTSFRHDVLAMANAIPSMGKKLIETVREWQRRVRSRRDLMALSRRDLWDMRVTRAEAEREANKPFWRG